MDSMTFGSKTPEFLDDGASIARRIPALADRDADVGAMFLREVLWRLQNEVGDGSATAAVLFHSVYTQGIRYLSAGGNAQLLKEHLSNGLQLILDELSRMTETVSGNHQLAKVALSICYDEEISRFIGEIFDVVGEFGRVEIRGGRTRESEREYVEGMYWDWGVHSRDSLVGLPGLRADLENPAILISDLEIQEPAELFPAIAMAIEAKFPALLIVAESLSAKVTSFLETNKKPERIQVLAVKTPGWDKAQKAAALADLAVLTGGRPYIRETGETLIRITPGHFGHARRAWVELTNFGIVGAKGSPRELRRHLAMLRASYQNTEGVIERDRLRERIGKLLGGSATLWIGGLTQREIQARTELAERTATSVRSAMMEGILPGGGVALLSCQPALVNKMKASTELDERAAYQILVRAVTAPFRTIVTNAGYNAGEILARVSRAGPGYGFDVNTGQVVHMMRDSVADPAYVEKSTVYASISSAALALTIDTIVHQAKPEKADLPEPAKKKIFNPVPKGVVER
jgi:chaperonin GroEL